jgi:hypothetical protein
VLLFQRGVERPHDLGVTPQEPGPGSELLGRQLAPRSKPSGRYLSAINSVAHATQLYLVEPY